MNLYFKEVIVKLKKANLKSNRPFIKGKLLKNLILINLTLNTIPKSNKLNMQVYK